jgi:short-subunit dehydrogenase
VTQFAARAKAERTLLFRVNTMDAQTVARVGYRALMKGKICVVPGWVNKLMIASARFAPRSAFAQITKKLMKP